jgi:hypothetical protein
MTADLFKYEFMPYPDYLLEARKDGDYSSLPGPMLRNTLKKYWSIKQKPVLARDSLVRHT